MVFVLNEKKAAEVFEKYSNVAAFTLGDAKKFEDDEKGIIVNYKKLSFLPSDDTVNAVLNGDLKASKVIKKAVKDITKIKLDEDGTGIAMAMTQLIGILQDNLEMEEGASKKYLKKHGPNILVFVTDGQDPARDKFMTKFVKAIFDIFGYEVITEGKVIKKLFKGKRKKINDRVRDFIASNKGMTLSKEGRILYKMCKNYYSVELLHIAMSETASQGGSLSEKGATRLARHLVSVFSNLSTLEITKMDPKNIKKVAKLFKKKNNSRFDAYEELVEILATMDLKLPKAKFGCNKKKGEPKMKAKKFVKFFAKKNNRVLLTLVYAHLTCRSIDVVPGTSEYNKTISNVLNAEIGNSEFSKDFVSAVKAYVKKNEATTV